MPCVQNKNEGKRVIIHKDLVISHDIPVSWVTVMYCYIPLCL